jgi:hypothetical protein
MSGNGSRSVETHASPCFMASSSTRLMYRKSRLFSKPPLLVHVSSILLKKSPVGGSRLIHPSYETKKSWNTNAGYITVLT